MLSKRRLDGQRGCIFLKLHTDQGSSEDTQTAVILPYQQFHFVLRGFLLFSIVLQLVCPGIYG